MNHYPVLWALQLQSDYNYAVHSLHVVDDYSIFDNNGYGCKSINFAVRKSVSLVIVKTGICKENPSESITFSIAKFSFVRLRLKCLSTPSNLFRTYDSAETCEAIVGDEPLRFCVDVIKERVQYRMQSAGERVESSLSTTAAKFSLSKFKADATLLIDAALVASAREPEMVTPRGNSRAASFSFSDRTNITSFGSAILCV